MKKNRFLILNILIYLTGTCTLNAQMPPRTYEALYAPEGVRIDGEVDSIWQIASWSEDFMDILGPEQKTPSMQTRMKMLWNDEALFILAWLEEEHIWAYLDERDAIIFRDNDFEVFVKPDPKTDHYFEYEINAKGAIMDLLMTKPYSENGSALLTWDSRSARHAVHLDGTLNDPGDVDNGWWVEIKIPYRDIEHHGADIRPRDGHSWRINFSRVQWQTDVIDGKYVKKKDEKGQNLREDNWVWTPQHAVNMHIPRHYGNVLFIRK